VGTISVVFSNTTTACAGAQVALSWINGGSPGATVVANSSAGICSQDGFSILASISGSGDHVVTVLAGASVHGLRMDATLLDGTVTANASRAIQATDYDNVVNLAWTLQFHTNTTTSSLRISIHPLPVPPPPSPPCSPGLCLYLTPEIGGDVDLSSKGPSDWVHYGLKDGTSVDREAGVKSPLIGPLLSVDGASLTPYKNCAVTFSWTNGSPATVVVKSPTGVYNGGGVGKGYAVSVSIPMSSTDVIVLVYVGVYQAQGNMNASLLDSTGRLLSSVNDSSLVVQQASLNGVYRIAVQPGSSGRSLRLLWTQVKGDTGNIAIQSIAVNVAVDCGTPLCGTRHPNEASDVDLTEAGNLDWTHWGAEDNTASDSKAGRGGGLIAPVKTIGSSTIIQNYANNPTTFTWANGEPDALVIKTPTGIYTRGINCGLTTTVLIPSTPAGVIVRVYLGNFGSMGVFNATLASTDGEPLAKYSNTYAHHDAFIGNAVFALAVKPASNDSNRTLTLTWVQTAAGGNIEWQAVAVQGNSLALDPQFISTTAPARGPLSGARLLLQAVAISSVHAG